MEIHLLNRDKFAQQAKYQKQYVILWQKMRWLPSDSLFFQKHTALSQLLLLRMGLNEPYVKSFPHPKTAVYDQHQQAMKELHSKTHILNLD